MFGGIMERKKLFVGGLPWKTTEKELRDVFSKFGEVEDVKVIRDRRTGKSKGFGFVTFGTPESAAKAKEGLNNSTFGDRTIKVDWAKEKEEK